ncbi:glycoside hydrolase family 32 protein [Clostridium thermosuccinogenes]|uniref:glycoside hydrolase family 32 protein n=1 Tax=Clostridium thermosuccinogenes TaxID=84032 RepID=UPI00137B2CA9|nr:glycoside hydrolase family 32 protein [Pseudoclostridium thermosuccinogenes]
MRSEYYNERYRPQYHFSPEYGWMNDPNGLVYYDGEYHLFYQFYPLGIVHGPMHWGHAVSTDLLRWNHLPIAMYPDDVGFMFSGCVVVDEHNTSGFQHGKEKTLVAVFTQENNGRQVQSIAYSNDRGRTWEKYSGNPVLERPEFRDFRDPKVFWHSETEKWIMVLAVKDRVHFYNSPNLKEWEFTGEFGSSDGSHDGVWECPDLFEMMVDGDKNNKKWVLTVSINGKLSGMQYFIGKFDGNTFVSENPSEEVRWIDSGKDFYAAVSWSDIPAADGRRLWIGWMNCWPYAEKIPAGKWRGNMSIVRELVLSNIDGFGLKLVQKPVSELESIRKEEIISVRDVWYSALDNAISGLMLDTYEILLEIDMSKSNSDQLGFKLFRDEDGYVDAGVDVSKGKVFVDRRHIACHHKMEGFAERHEAGLIWKDGIINLHIYVDRASLEMFVNEGENVFTELIFSESDSRSIEFYCTEGDAYIKSLTIYSLDSIWKCPEKA